MDEIDPEGTRIEINHELFDLWLKAFGATYGRLMEVPAMGPMREKIGKLMKESSTSVSYSATMMESLMGFQSVFLQAMIKTQEKMTSRIESDMESELEGKPTKETLRDFYNIWFETYSETFKEFLKSEKFASDLSTVLSRSIDFQKNNRTILEEILLKPNDLPTKSEIDDLTKEIYTLKRKMSELTSKLDKLSR
jgi:hypothetical protein